MHLTKFLVVKECEKFCSELSTNSFNYICIVDILNMIINQITLITADMMMSNSLYNWLFYLYRITDDFWNYFSPIRMILSFIKVSCDYLNGSASECVLPLSSLHISPNLKYSIPTINIVVIAFYLPLSITFHLIRLNDIDCRTNQDHN